MHAGRQAGRQAGRRPRAMAAQPHSQQPVLAPLLLRWPVSLPSICCCRRGGHPAAQHRHECGGRGAAVCGHADSAALGGNHQEAGGEEEEGRWAGRQGGRAAALGGRVSGWHGCMGAFRDRPAAVSTQQQSPCLRPNHAAPTPTPPPPRPPLQSSSERLRLRYTEQERSEIQDYAGKYAREIGDLLRRMPRPLLLLLKTNDCLRCACAGWRDGGWWGDRRGGRLGTSWGGGG